MSQITLAKCKLVKQGYPWMQDITCASFNQVTFPRDPVLFLASLSLSLSLSLSPAREVQATIWQHFFSLPCWLSVISDTHIASPEVITWKLLIRVDTKAFVSCAPAYQEQANMFLSVRYSYTVALQKHSACAAKRGNWKQISSERRRGRRRSKRNGFLGK